MLDPALVGEHGDYDPYAGMNPIQREEAESKRKREINEILGMIDEMRMSEDSNSDSDVSFGEPFLKLTKVLGEFFLLGFHSEELEFHMLSL